MEEKKKPTSRKRKTPARKGPKKRTNYTQRSKKEKELINCMALAIIPETEEQKAEREKKEAEAEKERIEDIFDRQAKAFGVSYDRPGRPSKISESVVQKILTALAIGCTYEESANYGGIHKRTLYNYFQQFPQFETLCESMRTKTPLKARRIANYYFDQVIKKIDLKEELSPDEFKLAYTYLRDKYPREFSKGIGGGMLSPAEEEAIGAGTPAVQVTNNTVNMIFSNTLGKSQFLKDAPISQE